MSNILHNARSETPRSDVLVHVSRNLRRLRQAAGLSQQALAETSGISRRMIVALEQGDANVSLSSLDRIAEALGVGFVDMVADPAAEHRQINEVMWRGTAPASVATLLGSAPGQHDTQMWLWVLGAGERYQAEPDPGGWHEMIYVAEGRLRLELDEGNRLIEQGGFAIFSSAQSYAYVNAGDGITRFIRNSVT